ncbi:MAG: Replication-associated recombination protein A [candidate division BRC1 bacterium ADurb.BinA364]|nr:MAG: Replication-associated recombination protein A [candidate division BRC1 bacterium ADurb.BinA364]
MADAPEPDMFSLDSAAAAAAGGGSPLADRMRPESLEEFVGQHALVGPGALLRRAIDRDQIASMILWGPPGSGKTTLAAIVANATQSDFVKLSAVTSGLKDVRAVIDRARHSRAARGRRVILFIDEIHRFNKAQQDAFLPHVEDGTIVLIGATTENPSFSVIGPLLSRCRVFTLQALAEEDILAILRRALADKERGLGSERLVVGEDVLAAIAGLADGDARRALNLLDLAARQARLNDDGSKSLDAALLAELTQRTHLFYDKTGEEHYNLISALHKSLRKSDPDAALYWLRRMLQSGEDPRYAARRMIRFASEDIGLADPHALVQALAAHDAYERLGSPEGELALAQAAIYLATAPKSNSLYAAETAAKEEIEASGSLPVPLVIRNAPTGLMKSLGYGAGYAYDHDSEDHYAPQKCLPDGLKGDGRLYTPGPFGFEREIKKRLDWWQKKRAEGRQSV